MQKLFGIKPSETKQVTQPEFQETVPDRDLFLEDRHPDELMEISSHPQKSTEKTLLEDLLSKDYERIGLRDGYETRDLSEMDEGLRVMAMEFRQVYDKALQDLDDKIAFIRLHLTDELEEKSQTLSDQVYHSLDLLLTQKKDMVAQKDLAMVGEGYIEKPYQDYKRGFKRGYKLYLEEKVMFKRTKTL
ncbi:hypothetical protein E4S40_10705 [Algoriphagus kandeliae]|uniref:Uncharacterized protein n=2 Tax=Algoriphagus kandeliae TaxID=2562278 RepID=A0A4Y9QTH5_9BACT|nr:hypothetical protein E4S40_10705 [Algoriphagus kandeliae]